MEAPFPKKRPPLWKRQFYVHKIQRTYAIRFGLFMFFSSLLVFGLVFLVPFIPPALKLVSQIPLEERARAANQLLVLAQTIWLARSEEHTSELQSLAYLVCRLLLEKKKKKYTDHSLPYTMTRIKDAT